MRTWLLLSLAAVLWLCPATALAQPAETEIPGVTAELVELRLAGGVLRLAVRYTNGGKEEITKGFGAGNITLVDVKSKQKHFPLKDADGIYVAGPMSSTMMGGAVDIYKMQPGQSHVIWAYFEPVPVGTALNVELPWMFPFENVKVTEGPGKLSAPTSARSSPAGAVATLVSARRADQALSVRLRLAPETPRSNVNLGSYFNYKDVFLFDPANKRRYRLLMDTEGLAQAQPLTVKAIAPGSFLPNWGGTTLMTLNFPAPPDTVKTADLIIPYFLPFEGIALEGLGGAAEGGLAAAGKTLGLEGALKDLGAKVTDTEIRIDLAADVLFDFDRAEIKKEAEPQLQKVATVLNANPGARVAIEGHTDGKGADAYNQTRSEQRAASVKQRLVANAQVAGANITTRGWGKTKPVAQNAKPDGSDDSEGRAKNRRVEIVVRKGA